jgi:GntR family transcriptional regulator, transcriptional repressor for pyruvate dehydrogenase complex
MTDMMAPDPFSPVRSRRLSEEIIRQIARLIDNGSLKLNDRFPSERDLQDRWHVSRPVLREAFRVLEMQGVVESRPGAGRYLIADHVPNPNLAHRRSLQEKTEHLLQVWEAREAVEAKAAELAARRATAQQIAAISETFERLEKATVEDLRRYDSNREFHMSVARASGNLLIEEMVGLLLSRSNAIRFNESLDKRDWADLQGRHQLIFNAVVAGDPPAARRAVVNHFDAMRRRLGVAASKERGLAARNQQPGKS